MSSGEVIVARPRTVRCGSVGSDEAFVVLPRKVPPCAIFAMLPTSAAPSTGR